MTYQQELEKPATEKHSLVVLRPRTRLLGWENYSANVWRAPFTLPISRFWPNYDRTDGWARGSAIPTGSGEFYHDEANGYVYVYQGTADPDDATDMDAQYGTVPGFTVEYDLYLCTKDMRGPRDPLDASSGVVDWRGVLAEAPQALLGSRQTLFGFNPLEESVLRIANTDGWMLEHLYDRSYNLASIRSYVMAGGDLERAAELGFVKEVFRGFGGAPRLDASGFVTIPSFDFLALLDRAANPSQRLSTTEFPNVEPTAVKPGREYFIRQVRGMVDDHEPVNIDYNATPATNVNRDFLTHEGTGVDGTVGHTVDDAAANTGTVTFFTTTPKWNPGDAVIISRSGTPRYTIVSSVNRATKAVTHGAIAGSAAPGDSGIRYYIGWVKVQDSDGNWWNLFASRNFSRINKATLGNNPDWLGFRLIDDWEADIGFPETFDPAKHKILCRVYGTRTPDTYADGLTDVGAEVDDGGVMSESISLLHFLLREAGLPNAMIDQGSFVAATTNHALGLVIPQNKGDFVAPSYKELIGLVLTSMIWKLLYLETGGEILVGLQETGPFLASADYEADEQDLRDFSFEHDYSSLVNRVELTYGKKEFPREGDLEIFLAASAISSPDGDQVVTAENRLARDLHTAENTFVAQVLQYMRAQAQVIADRYSFALGDRRAYYSFTLGTAFLERANLGASYQVKRRQLPGYTLDAEVVRERQTMLIESTKSANGVILAVEDQKGIQDNAGDW